VALHALLEELVCSRQLGLLGHPPHWNRTLRDFAM